MTGGRSSRAESFDVSTGAADVLDFRRAGLARVTVDTDVD
jgi:rare lipoprotein A (peptidoglycan hydrolase)